MTIEEKALWKLVMQKYPKTAGEKKCRIERQTMRDVRKNYLRKLKQGDIKTA